MEKTLAIFLPGVGVPSETFIRRHVECLAPQNTVIICNTVLEPPKGNWTAGCPTFCMTTRTNWAMHLLRKKIYNDRPLPFIDTLIKFLKKNNVGTILGEYLDHSLPLFRLLKGEDYNFFVHGHGYDLSTSIRDPAMRSGYLEYADSAGVITMSQKSKLELMAIGLPEQLIHVAHYGVDPPEGAPTRTNCDGLIRCLAVGRMTGKKAPFLLLESFRRAYERFPSLRLDYIGDGPMLAMAMQYVACYGLQDVVALHGVQQSPFVQQMLSQSDLFIQHSVVDPTNGDSEGLPVAILEAMAHSLPVVATRHAGIPEEVVDEENGLLVEEGDVEGMSAAIVSISQDARLRNQMGAAGYQKYSENFTWEINRSRLRSILNLA